MTIRVDIDELADLADLIARIDAGEDFTLVRRGQPVADVVVAPAPEGIVKRVKRVPGALAHLGPMEDPFVFFQPDDALKGVADPSEHYDAPPRKP